MCDVLYYQEIFEKLEKEGFNLNIPLVWSFFFYDAKKSNLKKVIQELDGHNYEYNIEMIDTKTEFRLTATKTEILSPEKLAKRLEAFNELAVYCDALFDGWEVSK